MPDDIGAPEAPASLEWYLWVIALAGIVMLGLVTLKFYRSQQPKDLPVFLTGILAIVGFVLITAPMWDRVFIQVSADEGLTVDLRRDIQKAVEASEEAARLAAEAKGQAEGTRMVLQQNLAEHKKLTESFTRNLAKFDKAESRINDLIELQEGVSGEIQRLKIQQSNVIKRLEGAKQLDGATVPKVRGDLQQR